MSSSGCQRYSFRGKKQSSAGDWSTPVPNWWKLSSGPTWWLPIGPPPRRLSSSATKIQIGLFSPVLFWDLGWGKELWCVLFFVFFFVYRVLYIFITKYEARKLLGECHSWEINICRISLRVFKVHPCSKNGHWLSCQSHRHPFLVRHQVGCWNE